MSALCAKPGCSDPVMGWFLTAREERAVVIAAVAEPHAIGLCDAHLARFTVPDGWDLDDQRNSPQTIDVDQEASDDGVDSKDSARRVWFAPEADPTDSPEQPAAAGSMLDRAFNGPSNSNQSNELTARRAKSVDAYGTGELPFPPFDAELAPRAALA